MDNFYFSAAMLWVASFILGLGFLLLFFSVNPRPIANVLAAVFFLLSLGLFLAPNYFIGLVGSAKQMMPFEVGGFLSIGIAISFCVVFLALIRWRLVSYGRSAG